jgi:hypothetical protein
MPRDGIEHVAIIEAEKIHLDQNDSVHAAGSAVTE